MTIKILGLDWFDVVVQLSVTITLGIAVDSFFDGRAADFGIGLVIAGSLAVLGWRRKRAMAEVAPPQDRMTEFDSRLAELEAQQARVLELEERLDFAERLLTQQRDRGMPPLGSSRMEG